MPLELCYMLEAVLNVAREIIPASSKTLAEKSLHVIKKIITNST